MSDLEVLMKDNCTESEAKTHLDRGTVVFSDLEEHFDDYMSEWGMDEDDRDLIWSMIKSKEPLPDWGVVQDEGKTYYIMYAL